MMDKGMSEETRKLQLHGRVLYLSIQLSMLLGKLSKVGEINIGNLENDYLYLLESDMELYTWKKAEREEIQQKINNFVNYGGTEIGLNNDE